MADPVANAIDPTKIPSPGQPDVPLDPDVAGAPVAFAQDGVSELNKANLEVEAAASDDITRSDFPYAVKVVRPTQNLVEVVNQSSKDIRLVNGVISANGGRGWARPSEVDNYGGLLKLYVAAP